MKERPILFSGPMVRAIIDGRKTQTRRIVKDWLRYVQREAWECRNVAAGFELALVGAEVGHQLRCPYGVLGDRLWVRETWAPVPEQGSEAVVYRADGQDEFFRWRPSIFMPRKFSRLTLEIVSVRVQRLEDISQADCRAEGCPGGADRDPTPRREYRTLWDSINKRVPMASNPWVWVIEFKKGEG